MATQLKAVNAPSQVAPEFGAAFDLSNPQHLAMRKLMADVYSRYANAINNGLPLTAKNYSGMGQGLERVAIYVLNDPALSSLCASMNFAMSNFGDLYGWRGAV